MRSRRIPSEMRARSYTGSIPLNRMEVSVRTEHDQFLTSKIPCIGAESADQVGFKVQKMSFGGDVENDPEK